MIVMKRAKLAQEKYCRIIPGIWILNGLQGSRIGVARNFFGFHEKVDQLMEEAIQVMREKGAEIIDPADIATMEEIGKYEFDVLLYEFKSDLNQYLSRFAGFSSLSKSSGPDCF